MAGPLPKPDRALVVGLFLACLLAYGLTAAPGLVAEGDCGEYVACARVGGVPHQPGFPTYMWAAWGLGALVPAEHLARALNLLSSLCGAATVACTALVALRLARRAAPASGAWVARGAALTTACVLGGATEPWNQALGAEVYTPSTLLLALCLERATACAGPGRWPLAALWAGLAFGAHYNAGVPAALLVAGGVLVERRALGPRGLARTLAGFALGLASFAYLPLRSLADPPLDFGDPETPARFLRALTLADMPTGKDVGRGLDVLGAQVAAVLGLAGEQGPAWLVLLLVAGAVACLRLPALRRAGAVLAALVVVVYAGILANANFELADEKVYELRFLFLPAYQGLALLAGLGCAGLALLVERRVRRAEAVPALVVVLACLPWLAGQARRLDKRADRLFHEYGEALLAVPEGPALLLTFGDNAWMPVAYLQTVHGARPDVVLVAVGLLRHAWYRAQLRARVPGLVLEENAPGVAALARANHARWNLYHADPRPQGVAGFQEVPTGVLMRLVPEGEPVTPLVPPAPDFTAPFAWLDRRERSVRADVVQAYVRTALWWRAAGHPAAAEEAFGQGLALVAPEPRMEEFHLARAGLLLELGDLRASLGRIGPARDAWLEVGVEASGSPPARLAEQRLSTFGR
ncbi:MAG TPA: DUF2723 domain-containing protein [Planctomycetota bacterium]